jgi:hypothetical protein
VDKLIDPVAEVFSSPGSPACQIVQNVKFLKDGIKLILAIIKNVLA